MSIVDILIDEDDFPLIIAIFPVMKGIPSRISESVFAVEASFAPSVSGTLRLDLSFPDEEPLPLSLAIDGREENSAHNEFIVPEGLHTLNLTSTHYRDVSLTFMIEAGTYTDLRIELEGRLSRLITEVPEGSRIFLDGEEIDIPGGDGIEIDAGEHTAVFKIGDYSLSRTFTVLPGTTTTLSVDMEIQVNSR